MYIIIYIYIYTHSPRARPRYSDDMLQREPFKLPGELTSEVSDDDSQVSTDVTFSRGDLSGCPLGRLIGAQE